MTREVTIPLRFDQPATVVGEAAEEPDPDRHVECETPLSIDALPGAAHGREHSRQRQAEEAGGGHLDRQAVRIRRNREARRERTKPFLDRARLAARDEPGAHGRAGVGALPRLGPVAQAPDLDADGEASPGAGQPEQACRNGGEAALGAVDIGAAVEEDAVRDRRNRGSTISTRVAARIRYRVNSARG